MSAPERNQLAAWVDDHLEAYVDDELSPEERRRVEAFVRQDAAAARQLELARRVRNVLGAFERPACPPAVTHAVVARARAEAREAAGIRPARAASWSARLEAAWASVLRPSLAMGAFVLVVVASALLGRAPEPPAEADLAATPAEVEQALQEVKWTLAYVSDVGRRTGRSIRREVLEERVAEPVQRALGDILRAEPQS